jgi:hypothetical protein
MVDARPIDCVAEREGALGLAMHSANDPAESSQYAIGMENYVRGFLCGLESADRQVCLCNSVEKAVLTRDREM